MSSGISRYNGADVIGHHGSSILAQFNRGAYAAAGAAFGQAVAHHAGAGARALVDSYHNSGRMAMRRDGAKTLKREHTSSTNEQTAEAVEAPAKKITSEDDDDGQLSTSVSLVTTNLPGRISYKPAIHTKIFRKKNRFYIDAKNWGNAGANWLPAGYTSGLAHCIPWKANHCYMDVNESYELHYKSSKYRYKRCAVKFSNMTSHTGQIQGTGGSVINLSYQGLLCYSQVASRNMIGPFGIISGNSNTFKTYTDVFTDFSDPNRSEGYRELDYHISLGTNLDTIGTSAVQLKLANLIDMANTRTASIPDSEFVCELPHVWRSSLGSITPGTLRNPINFNNADETNDSQGTNRSAPTNPIVVGAHQRNPLIKQAAARWSECICPRPNRTQHVYGQLASQNYDNDPHHEGDADEPDAFYFGFMVPNPIGADPFIYLGFELETELEVEWEEWCSTSHAHNKSNNFAIGTPAVDRSATWGAIAYPTPKPIVLQNYIAGQSVIQGYVDPGLLYLNPVIQSTDSGNALSTGMFGPNMGDPVVIMGGDGQNNVVTIDSGWNSTY